MKIKNTIFFSSLLAVFSFFPSLVAGKTLINCNKANSDFLEITTNIAVHNQFRVLEISIKNLSSFDIHIPNASLPWNNPMFIREILEINNEMQVKLIENHHILVDFLGETLLKENESITDHINISNVLNKASIGSEIVILWRYDLPLANNQIIQSRGCVAFTHFPLLIKSANP